MKSTRALLYWLMPGLGMKRWLLLFTFGVFVISLGLAVALDSNMVVQVYEWARFVAFYTTGSSLPPTVGGILLVLFGFAAVAVAMQQLTKAVLAVLLPFRQERLGNLLYQQRKLERGPHVVAIGGGTGLSTLLRGLKQYTANLTAVVTVADDGGSSGRLRGELGILPPGDIRNCMVALADTEPMMEQLFQYRFERGSLRGHSFGNLFISAMTGLLGDFERAVQEASKVLAIRGRVLPSTLENVELCARFQDGQIVCGESKIAGVGRPIDSVFLRPAGVAALPAVCQAITQADLVVVGPGSLYTSILPNLMIPEIAQALRDTKGLRIYVVNIMTQPGESEGYKASDHVAAIEKNAGAGLIDIVVINTARVGGNELDRYRREGADQVEADRLKLERKGYHVLARPLLAGDSMDTWIRHDSDELAALMMDAVFHRVPRLDLNWRFHYMLMNEWRRRQKTMASSKQSRLR